MKKEADRAWKVRPYRDGDEEILPDLYEGVSGMPFDFKYWHWLFKANPAGHGYIWFADHNGILAGQYAVVPIRMLVQGKPVRCTQSLATMTHPDYRKQGIFTTLAQTLFEATESGQVDLVYGFPNDNSEHGFLKYLDFFVLENLTTMVRPLNIAELLSLRIKSRIISKVTGTLAQVIFNGLYPQRISNGIDIRVERTSRFPKEVDDLFESCAPRFQNLIVRDYRYLKWRYEDHPQHSYHVILGYRDSTLQGYCVCGRTERKEVQIGLIMDLFSNPDDTEMITVLIRHALKHMATENLMLASTILSSRSPFLKPLRSLGFIFPSRRFPYILRVNSDELDSSTVKHVRDWHITFGDADFV